MKNMNPFRNLLPALFTAFLLTLIQGWGNTAQAQTTYPVLFRVDMSDYNGATPINGVFLNGSFNAWCGSCAPMTDANNNRAARCVQIAATSFIRNPGAIAAHRARERRAAAAEDLRVSHGHL